MPRRTFSAGTVTNTTGAPLRLTFHATSTTGRRETDLWTVDGSSNPAERIPNGVILTDASGAYSAFAGPDDLDTLYLQVGSSSGSRTQLAAAGYVASSGLPGTYATFGYARQQAHTESTLRIVTVMGGLEDEATPQAFATCTVAADTTNFDIVQGWKVTATAAGTPQMRYTPADTPKLAGASVIGIRVYIPDVTQITLIGLTINNPGAQWTRTSANFPQALVNGWNTLRWTVPSATTTGWGSPTRIDIFGTSTATSATFTVGHVWAELPSKASLIFIADGPYNDFLTGVYPALKARGIPVTWAIDPSLLGTGSGDTLRMTEAQLDTVAYENGNTVAAHAWGDVLTASATAAQIRADSMRVAKWLRNKGYPGGLWRAAWWQDAATNYLAAKDLYLGMRTYNSSTGSTAWPPIDRYNIPKADIIAATSSATVDGWFTNARDFKQSIVMYVHRIGTGANDAPQARWDQTLAWIDAGLAAGWLEGASFESLFFRSGGTVRTDLYGRNWCDYLDETGTRVTKRIP